MLVSFADEQTNPSASSCVCPPWPAQSWARKDIGKRENTRMLSSTVNHRELLCLQLPFSEELHRAETMAVLWSCVSSTSSTASDG